ncbi:sensor histidine kinase [Mucilaginibacter sp.]|uniref:sensor histidine kinase n=1 Tax=Mucilaginibacter sp. TaxID=1882438 RepID=UPI0035BBC9BE
MHVFIFLAIFLLITRVRKSLKFSPVYDKWNRTLQLATFGVIAIWFVCVNYLDDEICNILGGLLLLGVMSYMRKEPDFKSFGVLVFAHYPLAFMAILNGCVELIVPKFYNQYDNFFECAELAAFGWIFARFATSKKQREEIQRINERKSELEAMVSERTAELTRQKDELQGALKELQATQAQLIQQEKLASLGELTAGIAHEIQNPLNFVNNFSEVSMELIGEMEEELAKGDTEEVVAIANDIKSNLEKIRHHGQRADGIVKGMLQHSRASSNIKEPANINTIADEYFRLAYHGLRAKDKSFNAELVANLDPNLPLINIVSQDVGRVLLNMFTNAFYAVHDKKKTAGPDFRPKVEVSTRTIHTVTNGPKGIEIRVKDNGSGIPDAIKDKIMQPFFTTKPAGEGTGLGLSLSYDIIVKAHKGKIDIESKVGEGTEFIINLPLT